MASILARTAAAAGVAVITAALFASPAAADSTRPIAPKAAAGLPDVSVVGAAVPSQAAGIPKFRFHGRDPRIVEVTVDGRVVGKVEWHDISDELIARDYASDRAYIHAELGLRGSSLLTVKTKGHNAPYTAKGTMDGIGEDVAINLTACYVGNGYNMCTPPDQVGS